MNVKIAKDPQIVEILAAIASGSDPTKEQIEVLTKDYDQQMVLMRRQRVGPISIRVDGKGVFVSSDFRHVYGHA